MKACRTLVTGFQWEKITCHTLAMAFPFLALALPLQESNIFFLDVKKSIIFVLHQIICLWQYKRKIKSITFKNSVALSVGHLKIPLDFTYRPKEVNHTPYGVGSFVLDNSVRVLSGTLRWLSQALGSHPIFFNTSNLS
jgi:hypothetical protein